MSAKITASILEALAAKTGLTVIHCKDGYQIYNESRCLFPKEGGGESKKGCLGYLHGYQDGLALCMHREANRKEEKNE